MLDPNMQETKSLKGDKTSKLENPKMRGQEEETK